MYSSSCLIKHVPNWRYLVLIVSRGVRYSKTVQKCSIVLRIVVRFVVSSFRRSLNDKQRSNVWNIPRVWTAHFGGNTGGLARCKLLGLVQFTWLGTSHFGCKPLLVQATASEQQQQQQTKPTITVTKHNSSQQEDTFTTTYPACMMISARMKAISHDEWQTPLATTKVISQDESYQPWRANDPTHCYTRSE